MRLSLKMTNYCNGTNKTVSALVLPSQSLLLSTRTMVKQDSPRSDDSKNPCNLWFSWSSFQQELLLWPWDGVPPLIYSKMLSWVSGRGMSSSPFGNNLYNRRPFNYQTSRWSNDYSPTPIISLIWSKVKGTTPGDSSTPNQRLSYSQIILFLMHYLEQFVWWEWEKGLHLLFWHWSGIFRG
jgi:hypothetical protein